MSAKTMKKAIIQKTTPNYDEAIAVTTVAIIQPKPHEVLVKNRYLGVNASDLNAAVGLGTYEGKVPPFDIGFEGIGEIVEVGSEVTNLKVGQSVAYTTGRTLTAFAEYTSVVSTGGTVIPLPESKPEIVALMVSGLTAAISLQKKGNLEAKDKVLITAAAGGTGHIAVQLAKQVGCYVIGTCSSEEKVQYLKSIGCDRPINYKQEDLSEVLKTEFPDGVDVIWETVGGDTLRMLYQHLAENGRLIMLGSICSYNTDQSVQNIHLPDFPRQVMIKTQTISGFLLPKCKREDILVSLTSLYKMQATGQLKIKIDTGKNTKEGEFLGIESVVRALKYLYSGKNIGKVLVKL